MTKQEKHVYNSFLRISRSQQNRPFKLRKDFNKFDEDKNYIYTVKISNILDRNKSINLEDFLNAPYEVYNDGKYYDLNFYTTQRAIKVYSTFIKKRLSNDIDSPGTLSKIRDSLYFIYKFCHNNDITIKEYIDHKTNLMSSFILHVQENEIIMYTLFGFSNFERELNKTPYDVRKFILGDMIKNIDQYRKKYMASKKAKNIIRKGISKLYKIQKQS